MMPRIVGAMRSGATSMQFSPAPTRRAKAVEGYVSALKGMEQAYEAISKILQGRNL